MPGFSWTLNGSNIPEDKTENGECGYREQGKVVGVRVCLHSGKREQRTNRTDKEIQSEENWKKHSCLDALLS